MFTGVLPPELGALRNLREIHLQNNMLSGPLPEEIGGWMNVAQIELQDNDFAGEIPTSFMDMIDLRRNGVNLGGNCLFASDDALREFLNFVDNNWEDVQNDECE
jgi:hypothetical protein